MNTIIMNSLIEGLVLRDTTQGDKFYNSCWKYS